MTAQDQCERERVVAIARSLVGVPWVHMGRSRYGLDCAGFALFTFYEAGLLSESALGIAGYYPPDFMYHQKDERFLNMVLEFAKPVQREALPGDLTMHRVGHVVSHLTIVENWPNVFHAWADSRCVVGDDVTKGRLKLTYQGLYTYKGWT